MCTNLDVIDASIVKAAALASFVVYATRVLLSLSRTRDSKMLATTLACEHQVTLDDWTFKNDSKFQSSLLHAHPPPRLKTCVFVWGVEQKPLARQFSIVSQVFIISMYSRYS